MNANERYELWCRKVEDEALKKELDAMRGNAEQIENAFYKDLEFGTGGLRGIIGAGTNCLNVLTIAKVTQGIATRMRKCGQTKVAISCDSRINSELFKEKVACVMAANGIKSYVVKRVAPTPFLSFLTREKGADIGVMITASHNPSKYNGYKVYGADGCQLTDEPAKEMIGYIEEVDPFDVKTESFEYYLKNGMTEYVGDDVYEKYLEKVQEQGIGTAEGLKVTYSPLNGTGYRLVPEILKRCGVSRIDVVPEQAMPDGNFTTCSYPNPEKPEALQLALALAEKEQSDIVIATDPDADRIGTAVRHKGAYRQMTGNEIGVLLTDFVLSERKRAGTLPKNPVLVTTIVSTELAEQVAKKYNATFYRVLTGFKYIGGIIGELESKGEESRFVLGFEESYGYLAGSYVRDKDAVVASMLVAQMTAHWLRQGKTLVDRIEEIYAEFGTYEHKLKSYEYPGAEGSKKMTELLGSLRKNLPAKLGDSKIVKTIDYLTQKEFNLPKSNVLSFKAENGSSLIVRPSGTEPLIKLYVTAASTPEKNAEIFKKIFAQLEELFG